MMIIDFFKDWLLNNEEKSKFKQAWIKEKLCGFSDATQGYHSDMAYEIYRMSKKIEELEQKIK